MKLGFALFLSILLFLTAGQAGLAEEPAQQTKKEGALKKTGRLAKNVVSETLETPLKVAGKLLNFALKPIVITPLGAEEYAFNVTKNVSVVTQNEIKNSSATTLPELLENKSGVVVSGILGNPKGAIVDIRGFGEASNSNVLVLVDGRRTNQIDLSGVDWAQIDLNTIERIEIVKGASSVLYGDNASGGVINIITKRGRTTKPSVTTGWAVGSDQYHTEYGTFEGYHDILDYFLSYSHRDEDGYRENNSFKANNWFGRITLHPIDFFEFEATTGYHKDKYGQPGALYQPDLDTLGRRGTRWPDDIAKTEDVFLTSRPKVRLKLPGNNNLTASVHTTYRRRESDSLNISSPTWQGQTTRHIDSGQIQPKLEVNSALYNDKCGNAFIIGTDLFIASDYKQSGNILTMRDTVKVTKRTTALYLHDNAEVLDRFLLNGGYRYEWANYKFEQKGLLTDNAKRRLSEYAFELGGGYKYNTSSQVYINYSRSYRYPTTEEYHESRTAWFNPWTGTTMFFGGLNQNIRAQTGYNLETGIKDNSLKWLSVNADYFWILTKHEIFYDINSAAGNINYSPRTRRFGFDIEARANLMDKRLIPYINYTHQRARFDGGIYDNKDITLVPANKYSAGITAIPLTNLTWNVALKSVGSCFRINDPGNQVQKIGSYTTVNTKLSYKWKTVTLYASVKNVFNRKYWVSGATSWGRSAITYYPAAGTAFEIGGTAEF